MYFPKIIVERNKDVVLGSLTRRVFSNQNVIVIRLGHYIYRFYIANDFNPFAQI